VTEETNNGSRMSIGTNSILLEICNESSSQKQDGGRQTTRKELVIKLEIT